MPIEWRPMEYGSEYIDYDPICEAIRAKGATPYIVIKDAYKAISAANLEFNHMTGALTHMRVGTTGSYIKYDIVSSNSNDKSAAAGHVRSVRAWGVDSNNYLRVEANNLSGTTKVSSTNSYYEVGDLYMYTHGSGGADAAGRIDLGITTKVTNEVMSIASNQTRSINTRIPIPKYWRARILAVDVSPLDAAVSSNSGVMVFPMYYSEGDMSDYDGSLSKVMIMRDGRSLGPNTWPTIFGNDTTYSTLEFYGIRHANSETWTIKAKVVLWPSNNAVSAAKHIHGV